MDGTAKTFQVIKQRSPEHVTSGNAHVYARTRPSETRRIPESMRAQKINRCVASKLDRTSQGYTNGIRISISMFKKELSGAGCGTPSMLLVKLGGSVVTEKAHLRTP